MSLAKLHEKIIALATKNRSRVSTPRRWFAIT